MSMRVFFLQDFGDHKAGDDEFIHRDQGRTLCYQNVATPWAIREKHPLFKKLQEKTQKVVKPKAPAKKRGRPKKTAMSKQAETREKAVT